MKTISFSCPHPSRALGLAAAAENAENNLKLTCLPPHEVSPGPDYSAGWSLEESDMGVAVLSRPLCVVLKGYWQLN